MIVMGFSCKCWFEASLLLPLSNQPQGPEKNTKRSETVKNIWAKSGGVLKAPTALCVLWHQKNDAIKMLWLPSVLRSGMELQSITNRQRVVVAQIFCLDCLQNVWIFWIASKMFEPPLNCNISRSMRVKGGVFKYGAILEVWSPYDLHSLNASQFMNILNM